MNIEENNHLGDQLLFENQTFNKHVIEKGLLIEGDVNFRNCVFKMPLVFENINIKGTLYFFDCVFSSYTSIKNCSINTLIISGGEFQNDDFHLNSNKRDSLNIGYLKGNKIYINGSYICISINSITVNKFLFKDVNINYSTNESKINLNNGNLKKLEFRGSSIYSDILFKKGNYKTILFESNFNNAITFEDNIKVEDLFFESSTFNYRINIKKGTFDNINFYRSIFNGLVFISELSSQNEDFTRNLKIKMLSLHSCNFNKDFNVWLSCIEDISLSNNIFNQLFHFNNYDDTEKTNDRIITFRCDGVNRGTIIIEKAYLDMSLSGINFGDIFIKDLSIWSVLLIELDNKESISFNNVDSGSFFTIDNSVSGKLNFINTNINNFSEIVIANSNIEGINLSKYPDKIRSYSSNSKVGYGLKDKSKNISNLKHVYN